MTNFKIEMKAIQYVLLLTFAASFYHPTIVGASSQGFNVLKDAAKPGMVVSLTKNTGVVEPTNSGNAASTVGVLDPTVASLSLQPGQLNVTTDGAANALVSTLNGDIQVGDRIGVSSLNGIGAKLTTSGWMVGIAQASLDASSTSAVATDVKDSAEKKHKVYIAQIPVIVKVNYFSAPAAAPPKPSVVPNSVQSIADKIAGKHVSLVSLILSSILLLIGLGWAASVVYAMVRGSLDAVGRQPLAKSAISRAVLRSAGIAAAVITGVLLGAWLLLRFA